MSSEAQRRRSQVKLLLIAAFFALPILAAFLTYRYGQPARHRNYGELLNPQRLPSVRLTGLDGRSFRLDGSRGKWVLLSVGPGACPRACQENLYLMRQVRLAQGKDMERIERVWLIDDGAVPSPGLLAAYSGTRIAYAGKEFLAALPAASPRDHIYVIDPRGYLMMRFPRQPDPFRVLKDVGLLLRVSWMG